MTFRSHYVAVFTLYNIDPAAAAAATPSDVARLIYAVAQEAVPVAFLQWNQGTRRRGA